jgi:hypothetical protein
MSDQEKNKNFIFIPHLGQKFRELAKNKILIFFLLGHLEGRQIRAPTNKKILTSPRTYAQPNF